MNHAAFAFFDHAQPRGFLAALVINLCCVLSPVRAVALGSRACLPPLTTGCDVTAAGSAVTPSQALAGAMLSPGFGVTTAGAVRGNGAGNDFSKRSVSVDQTFAPTAQLAEADMKELSGVTLRRISAALPYENTLAAVGQPAAASPSVFIRAIRGEKNEP